MDEHKRKIAVWVGSLLLVGMLLLVVWRLHEDLYYMGFWWRLKKDIGAIFIICVAGIIYYCTPSVTPYTDKFLALVNRGDYRGAYAMLGDRWKQQATLQQFADFEKSIRGTLDTCNSKTLSGINAKKNNGASTAQVVYTAQFSKGPATLTFTLEKQRGDWKVQDLKYDSDLL